MPEFALEKVYNYTDKITTDFANEVKNGLNAEPKTLSSKYFYDAKGDKLFQQIMELEEYYLTRSEYQILQQCKEKLTENLQIGKRIRLIELGAGDGFKTKLLLSHFIEKNLNFEYVPIDISNSVLVEFKGTLELELPKLEVNPINGDYFEVLKKLSEDNNTVNVVLFLGSNIGNFTDMEARQFLKSLSNNMKKGDFLFIGFDLKKNPEVILSAYNDKQGITAEFNYNLLHRINNELGGNFNVDNFSHYPIYDPLTGQARSYLVSKCKQVVCIEKIGQTYTFEAWESIHLEISRKYSIKEIENMADVLDFEPIESYFDDKEWFVDCLWRVT